VRIKGATLTKEITVFLLEKHPRLEGRRIGKKKGFDGPVRLGGKCLYFVLEERGRKLFARPWPGGKGNKKDGSRGPIENYEVSIQTFGAKLGLCKHGGGRKRGNFAPLN